VSQRGALWSDSERQVPKKVPSGEGPVIMPHERETRKWSGACSATTRPRASPRRGEAKDQRSARLHVGRFQR